MDPQYTLSLALILIAFITALALGVVIGLQLQNKKYSAPIEQPLLPKPVPEKTSDDLPLAVTPVKQSPPVLKNPTYPMISRVMKFPKPDTVRKEKEKEVNDQFWATLMSSGKKSGTFEV